MGEKKIDSSALLAPILSHSWWMIHENMKLNHTNFGQKKKKQQWLQFLQVEVVGSKKCQKWPKKRLLGFTIWSCMW